MDRKRKLLDVENLDMKPEIHVIGKPKCFYKQEISSFICSLVPFPPAMLVILSLDYKGSCILLEELTLAPVLAQLKRCKAAESQPNWQILGNIRRYNITYDPAGIFSSVLFL